MSRKSYGIYSVEDRRVSSRLFRLRLAEGLWPRPSKEKCDACGQRSGPIEWHREDYSIIDPSGLITICYLCHRILHMRDRYPEGWDFYRDEIRRGGLYRWTKDIGTAANTMRKMIPAPAYDQHRTSDVTILDRVHEDLFLPDPPDIRRARMDRLYGEYASALGETQPAPLF